MSKRNVSLSLKLRLLIPTIVILTASIIGLSAILVLNQQRQLGTLGDTILASVNRTNTESAKQFERLENGVTANLNQLASRVGTAIAESTRAALEKETTTMRSDLEKSLTDNAQSMAQLLARVAPPAILANNFLDLIAYTKSATENPDVIYAFYLKPDGRPLTRYMNRKDPIIKAYIKQGEGRKKIDKVIHASKRDPAVLMVEHLITLDGKTLGKILLCVNKAATIEKMDEMSTRFSALIQNNTTRIDTTLAEQSGKVMDSIRGLLSELSDQNKDSANDLSGVIRDSLVTFTKKTYQVVGGVGGIAIVIVAALLFFLLSNISRKIRNIVENLSGVSDRVNSSSEQISNTSKSLADGSSRQAATVEETSSSLEEISAMTRRNADNVSETNRIVKETRSVVGQASGVVDQLTSSMSDISEASDETRKIVKTIDEIAFQTNLLALNAAVEAARAGEAGAGFAVVADEVRNLAMRAAEAARNTADLIESTVNRIKDGENLMSRTNDTFSEVAESTASVEKLIDEIAAASNEQAQGIQQISEAVMEMDAVIQQNAAHSEESAAAASELKSEADRMNNYVNSLVALVDGTGNNGQPGNQGMAPGYLGNGKPVLDSSTPCTIS